MPVQLRATPRRVARLAVLLAGVCGIAGAANALTCPRTSALVPVFEQRAASRPDALLTTDPHEGYLLGYQQTRLAFNAVPQNRFGGCPSGTNYVLRLFNPKDGAFLYTTDFDEMNGKLAKGWQTSPFIPDTTNFCIADKDETACSLLPLMRLNSMATPPRPIAYTTSAREARDCILTSTCTYDPTPKYDAKAGNDAIGRVWPKPPDYVIRIYTEPYQPLTIGAGTTPITPDKMDASNLVDFPSGFSFAYYGRQRDFVYASTNGFLTFDYGLPANTAYNPNTSALSGHMPPYNVIAAWWEASYAASASSMLTKVLGTGSNRRVVIQWGAHDDKGWTAKWDKFGTDAMPDSGFAREMQIHLVEGSNRIEFHYGPKDPGAVAGQGATIGITGDYGIESLSVPCSPNCRDNLWPGTGNVVLAMVPEPPGFNVQEAELTTPITLLTEGGSVKSIALTNGQGGQMVDLGFSRPFEFDGQKLTQVGISSAGAMSFLRVPPFDLTDKIDPVRRTDIPPTPDDLATAGDGSFRDIIAAWWARMFMGNDGKILFTTTGSGTNHVFIVEWQGLRNEDFVDMWGTHVDTERRNIRVELRESDNSIKLTYPDSHSTFFWGGAAVGIINYDRDGTSATYRLLNCTPWCIDREWPTNMTFTLTPDTRIRPTWHDVAQKLASFKGADTCSNCHSTLIGNDYVMLARVLAQPPIERPATADGPDPMDPAKGCGVSGSITTDSLITLNKWGTPDPVRTWFLSTDEGLLALTDPGGGFPSGNMPWHTWCSVFKEKPNVGMRDDDMKSIIRRWVVHNTP